MLILLMNKQRLVCFPWQFELRKSDVIAQAIYTIHTPNYTKLC